MNAVLILACAAMLACFVVLSFCASMVARREPGTLMVWRSVSGIMFLLLVISAALLSVSGTAWVVLVSISSAFALGMLLEHVLFRILP